MDKSHVSIREYYSYRLQMRPNSPSFLLHTGRLLQQYVTDQYVKIETQRLDFYRTEQMQKQARIETVQGIVDSCNIHGITDASMIGQPMLLPSSFIGSPKDMQRRYMDAMTLVQKFGKPDFFLTMTCNPMWPEIQAMMAPVDTTTDRPDLVSRVFNLRLKELKHEILKCHLLGKVQAYSYVVEFQKRGLPHLHMLLIMQSQYKIRSPSDYDAFISAELPDPVQFPYLYALVTRHMLHGPCGLLNPNNFCMENGKCKNHYPKEFVDCTTHGTNGYPIYRRRNDGRTVFVRHKLLDNRWVVPYNPYLLAKFDCHINLEICSTVKLVKYLYKYVYKGHDRVAFTVGSETAQGVRDEISDFQTGRWIAPPEACWRIYSFPLNELSLPVLALQLHLPNYQYTSFRPTDSIDQVKNNTFLQKTMLTEFFWMNATDEYAKSLNLLYREFPEFFVWESNERRWHRRKQGILIGRVVTANPIEKERYYLRILLQYRRGPTSFIDLKTVSGHVCDTFREACVELGLLQSDTALADSLQEAAHYNLPYSYAQMFATILVFCAPSEPQFLWNIAKHHCHPNQPHKNAYDSVAASLVNKFLLPYGTDITDFGIHIAAEDLQSTFTSPHFTGSSASDNIVPDLDLINTLNEEQQYVFDIIVQKLQTKVPYVCFVNGAAGTGKTYLYQAILAFCSTNNYLAIPVATSGVAASLLPNGQTAHSKFKLPIDLERRKTCNVSKQSKLASHFRSASLIIWDEISMAQCDLIKALDEMLRDITDCSLDFGGKIVIFGGDFCQITPVVPNGTKELYIKSSCVSSPLFVNAHKFQLTVNMRAEHDTSFARFLQSVGNNSCPHNETGEIHLPPHILLPYEDEKLSNLIDCVFPKTILSVTQAAQLTSRSILATTNETVDSINALVIERMEGEPIILVDVDVTKDPTQQSHYEDYLNSITPNGMPPHTLVLKVGAPIMLLKNLDPSNGLCNGTRLICKHVTQNVICAEIAMGPCKGRDCFIPKIPTHPKNSLECSIEFTRTQFPVKLCYSITINKSQGQTLDTVGLFLNQPVFMHGQLYVALSRTRTFSALHIVLKPTIMQHYLPEWTKNIVYNEILQLAEIQ